MYYTVFHCIKLKKNKFFVNNYEFTLHITYLCISSPLLVLQAVWFQFGPRASNTVK